MLGYAAFGNEAPGNFLTGFGFFDPFWLIDIGNVCIAIHLIGAYQVPLYKEKNSTKSSIHKIQSTLSNPIISSIFRYLLSQSSNFSRTTSETGTLIMDS